MKYVCPDCLSGVENAHAICPACGFTRPGNGWLADPLTGLILGGRYRLEGRLGAGGMASVFRASRIGALGGHVAVKVLAPRFARTVVARRFEREAQVVARLTNPHVVRIYDFDSFAFPGSELNLYYIAMELIDGATLAAVMEMQGKVNFLWGIDTLRQAARGLEEAHQQGIVHRDLKPSNIMLVTQRGATHVKILDFGIAALADREQAHQEKLTQTGFVSGTPDYMAPEQAVGDPDIGPPADIFALGIIAYELFSGHRPFLGGTMESLLARVTQQAPSLRSVIADPAFPPELFRIVDKMLVREPENRYPHAGALLDDLGRFPTLQTTPDFVPPADLLKRYATESQPAFMALVDPVSGSAATGDAQPAILQGDAAASHDRSRKPVAERTDGEYAPPPATPQKGNVSTWIAAFLVLGAIGTSLALALDTKPPAVASPTPPAPPREAQPLEIVPPEAESQPEDGAVLVEPRPPVAIDLVEKRLPLGRELVAIALPSVVPPLYAPLPIELGWEAAGKPQIIRSATMTVWLGDDRLTTVEGDGRPDDRRVRLAIPPRPIPARYDLDVELVLADGERAKVRLSYDTTTHEVRARP